VRIVVERAVAVPMRDGVALATDIYRPDGRRCPALLSRTPYGTDLPPLARPAHGMSLVDAGYAVVLQDVRGRGRSEGTFAPFAQEPDDGEDTLAWLCEQPWCDGRIGLLGSSYSGQLQWSLAARRPPGLAAIAPHVADPDVRRWFWRGGALEWGFALWWTLQAHVVPAALRARAGADAAMDLLDRVEELYAGGPDALPAVVHELAPSLRAWTAPRCDDEDAGAPFAEPRASATPALVLAGWHDIFLDGALASFAAAGEAGAPRRLLIGPWSHTVLTGAYPERDYGVRSGMDAADVTGRMRSWFDRWLRDGGEHAGGAEHDGEAPVRYFLMGADAWRDADRWPPAARDERWFLDAGALRTAPPAVAGTRGFAVEPADPVPTQGGQTLMAGTYAARRAGPWDQRRLHDRDDVVTFLSEPLQRPLDVIGTVRLSAFVSSTAREIDVTGKLVDVDPGGRAEHVVDGVRRLSATAGPAGLPALAPGEIREVVIDVGTTATRFRRGHRIGVEIAGSNFPRFDLCPRNGRARTEVHHGPAHPSHLLLPVHRHD
jgi:putative CocE/NonD family hydrolase